MKLKIQHDDCDGEVKLYGWDNGACGDPECCGEREYGVVAKCLKCRKTITVTDLCDDEEIEFI